MRKRKIRNRRNNVAMPATMPVTRVVVNDRCDKPCNGVIVSTVTGRALGQHYGSMTPRCERCGKPYPNSRQARLIGYEEFDALMKSA